VAVAVLVVLVLAQFLANQAPEVMDQVHLMVALTLVVVVQVVAFKVRLVVQVDQVAVDKDKARQL
jgi:Tfp pilus assembly protein PilO